MNEKEKNTADTTEAANLFAKLSPQDRQVVIDWIRSLLSER